MNALNAFNSNAHNGSIPFYDMALQGLGKNSPAPKNTIPVWNTLSADAVARIFDANFSLTGCSILKEKGKGAPAIYTNFTNFPGQGLETFKNAITLQENRSEAQLEVSLLHEKLHAIQWNSIPELHASPYNQLAYQEIPVILSPQSWILMTLLTERDAYAKTAWLSHMSLEKSYSEEFAAAASAEIVNQHDVAYWHGKFPDDIPRRQDVRDTYFLDGSLYISKITTFLSKKSFYHEKTLPFIVPYWKSFEIDTYLDFLCIEAIMTNIEKIKSIK